MPDDAGWQTLEDTRSDVTTYRMPVPGGWLYRCIVGSASTGAVAMAFVPDAAAELTTLSESESPF